MSRVNAVFEHCAQGAHTDCPSTIVVLTRLGMSVSVCRCPCHRTPASDPSTAEVEPLVGEFYD